MSRPRGRSKPRKALPVRAVPPPPPAEPEPQPAPDPAPEPPEPAWVWAAGLVVASMAAFVLAIVCAFYTPLRAGRVLVPVSLVLVVVGLAGIIRFAHWVTGRPAVSLIPGAVWLVVSLMLSARTTEGDLVLISSNWVAGAYLIAGCVTIGVMGYRMILSGSRPDRQRPDAHK